MAALRWFMDYHTSLNQTLGLVPEVLARMRIWSAPFTVKWSGQPLGTSFCVVYAIIFMIWFETPKVNDVRFRQYILPYKRFIH